MDDLLPQVPNVLRHPFVLALVTAVLVNGLTRTWQDRQKALEVTTGLVAAMSEASTKALLAADRGVKELRRATLNPQADNGSTLHPPSESGAERRERVASIRDALEAWESASAVLGTKLEAYFPTARSVRTNRPHIAEQWTQFSADVSRSMSAAASGNTATEQWRRKHEELYRAKARLIRLVLDERPTGFDRGWVPWSSPIMFVRVRRWWTGLRSRADRRNPARRTSDPTDHGRSLMTNPYLEASERVSAAVATLPADFVGRNVEVLLQILEELSRSHTAQLRMLGPMRRLNLDAWHPDLLDRAREIRINLEEFSESDSLNRWRTHCHSLRLLGRQLVGEGYAPSQVYEMLSPLYAYDDEFLDELEGLVGPAVAAARQLEGALKDHEKDGHDVALERARRIRDDFVGQQRHRLDSAKELLNKITSAARQLSLRL